MNLERLSERDFFFLFAWFLVLFIVLCYDFLRFASQKRRLPGLLLPAAAVAADYFMLQYLTEVFLAHENGHTLQLRELGTPLVLGILITFTAAAVLLAAWGKRWNRTHISQTSVKESFDDLPVGLCYCWPDGLPKLKNARMESICHALTGQTLHDGSALWDTICAGNVQPDAEVIFTDADPMARLPDGRVYSFRRTEIVLEDQPLFELAAIDVTEEYIASAELRRKEARADDVNRRLRELNATITQMTVERETLEAKTFLHDELGHTLLAAKRYLADPSSVDRDVLLEQWRNGNQLMKNEGPNALRQTYVDVVRSAWLLGVEVEIDGALPELAPARDVAELALTTCLTNTLRHAQGSHLYVSCGGGEDCYTLKIQNDGRQPDGPISEGGGLGLLRKKTESIGGTLRIDAVPRFTLTLTIPKEAKPDGEGIDR